MLLALIVGLLVFVAVRLLRKTIYAARVEYARRSVPPAPPTYSDNIIPFRRKA